VLIQLQLPLIASQNLLRCEAMQISSFEKQNFTLPNMNCHFFAHQS
jgi:hypothetical protein